jgi:hypothetical protein
VVFIIIFLTLILPPDNTHIPQEAIQETQPLSTQACIQNRDYPHQWWLERHQQKRVEAKIVNHSSDIVRIGDSIIQGWEGAGAKATEPTIKTLLQS